jgi:hypothetical protein
MINKSMNSIAPNRLQINLISGYIKDHEKSFGGILGDVNDSSDRIDRSNYLIDYVISLNTMGGNKRKPELDFYTSTTNEHVFNATAEYDNKIILPYRDYKNGYWTTIVGNDGQVKGNSFDFHGRKIMLAITPIIRRTQEELNMSEQYAQRPIWKDGEHQGKVTDIEYFTYEEFDKKQMNKNPSAFVSFSKNFFQDEEIDSHKLVEKWMIYTNEKIATHLIENYPDKNIIIRSQEKSLVEPKELDEYLYIYGEKSAKYDLYNSDNKDFSHSHSHYRLNLQIYTHFTSPIRRAVDFYIHSLLLGIEYSLTKENIQEYIENINKFTKSNRKFQRKVERICFLANIKNADKHIETSAYIVEIENDKYIRVYIPEYKLEEKIYCNNITYKLYDKINIRLYVFLLNDNIFDKLKIEIV